MTREQREEAYKTMLSNHLLGIPNDAYLTIRRAMVQCPICGRNVIDNGDGTATRHINEKGEICK